MIGLVGLGVAADGAGVIGIEVISPVLVEGATDTEAGAGSKFKIKHLNKPFSICNLKVFLNFCLNKELIISIL